MRAADAWLTLRTPIATLIVAGMMHTRPIPSTGVTLPVIGCGTWLGFDVGSRPGELPQRGQVLAELFAGDGRVIDSSPMYGSAEQVVGDLLHAADARAKAFVATKVWTTGKQAGIAQMNRSMALLRCDAVDLMQVHNLEDWKTHLPTLREWKARRRIGYIGVTHYAESAHPDLERVMRTEPLDFVQFNYSAASRGAEQRLLPLAAEKSIAVLVNLPFGGGALLRALHEKPLPGWAREIGCTSWSQVLLKFVLAQPAVTCVIPGTSSPAHMRGNALAGHGELPPPSFWARRVADITG
jgi:aryl-alcohol dehydrogenase-like predicted oxidoreductase